MFKRSILLLVAGLVAAWGGSAFAQKDLRWGTSAVGSSGHRALTAMANVLNPEMTKYQIIVQPTPGAVISVKGFALGQFDGNYGSDVAFYELANNIKRFKGFKSSIKQPVVQSFWAFTVELGVAIHARDQDNIKSWKDLEGKAVFTGNPPWDTRAHLERLWEALGIKTQYRQVDLSAAGSLLDRGGIAGMALYTNGEATTAPWITEAGLATDWAALNPSPDEVDRLQKAGYAVFEQKPAVFKRDVHQEKVILFPFYYGFHVGLDVPEADVYQMLKIVEKNVAALAKGDKAFSQIAKDMPGFQRRGVTSAANLVPIHPGLAKYMREKGVWDAKWDAKVAKQ
jgi:uncharacterized protein